MKGAGEKELGRRIGRVSGMSKGGERGGTHAMRRLIRLGLAQSAAGIRAALASRGICAAVLAQVFYARLTMYTRVNKS